MYLFDHFDDCIAVHNGFVAGVVSQRDGSIACEITIHCLK
jgi:hypothetical protein